MAYDGARERLGRDRGRAPLAADRGLRSTDSRALAGDAFRRVGSLRLAADEAERDVAPRGARRPARGRLRRRVARRALRRRSTGRFHGALLHPRDGALHPARWVRRLGRLRGGGRRRDARAQRGSTRSTRSRPSTSSSRPTATRAGSCPSSTPSSRPTRGQMLATEPLPSALFDRPHYARHGFDYWQQTPDGRLVVGGKRDAALEPEYTADEETTRGRPARARGVRRRTWSARRPRITHRWAGIWGATPDELPLVGPRPGHATASGSPAATRATATSSASPAATSSRARSSASARPSSTLFDPARSARASTSSSSDVGEAPSSPRSARARRARSRGPGSRARSSRRP